ncbi:hypothetical protein SO802_010276 [Lithocarpus litseifolius]|uniref:NAC domain-containing protein n=1 Tax=Lithocarpus litseifolius TaxID=425828 RepID=A0AAW2DEZ8_9ROSI
MYDLPPGVVFGPTDPEIVLYYLLNRVNGEPMFEDSMNYITECDVYGDSNAWIKVFQETHMERLYFYAKLKKKNQKGKRIERSTQCGTWRCQKDEQLFLNGTQYGSKRSFTFVAKNGFNGMGRWTMHEFRLDGAYGNTTNHCAFEVLKWHPGLLCHYLNFFLWVVWESSYEKEIKRSKQNGIEGVKRLSVIHNWLKGEGKVARLKAKRPNTETKSHLTARLEVDDGGGGG